MGIASIINYNNDEGYLNNMLYFYTISC